MGVSFPSETPENLLAPKIDPQFTAQRSRARSRENVAPGKRKRLVDMEVS
jgi:hypothetical protein